MYERFWPPLWIERIPLVKVGALPQPAVAAANAGEAVPRTTPVTIAPITASASNTAAVREARRERRCGLPVGVSGNVRIETLLGWDGGAPAPNIARLVEPLPVWAPPVAVSALVASYGSASIDVYR